MTEQKKSYVLCPKCNSEAFKVWSIEEINAQYPDDIKMQVALKRHYQCSDTEKCAYAFEASMNQIVQAFIKVSKAEGKTKKDIVKELTENVLAKIDKMDEGEKE